jgi:ketosteroid isomerase-like protein
MSEAPTEPKPVGDTPVTGATATEALASQATRELAVAFSSALAAGDEERLAPLLANHVAYRTPGRHAAAGVHRGRDRVMRTLVAPADASLREIRTEVTEIVVDARRAFVVLRTTGEFDDGVVTAPVDVEVALHLQTDGERILGITEYTDDQYVLDRILPGAPAAVRAVPERTGRWRRWWQRSRR